MIVVDELSRLTVVVYRTLESFGAVGTVSEEFEGCRLRYRVLDCEGVVPQIVYRVFASCCCCCCWSSGVGSIGVLVELEL